MRGDQLAEPERLHDVVVGTELETDDTVDLVAARRHDDDRDVGLRAQPATQLEAVEVGEAEVEQHDVGVRAVLVEVVERAPAGVAVADREPFTLEAPDEGHRDVVVVLDEEHVHAKAVDTSGGAPLPNLGADEEDRWPPGAYGRTWERPTHPVSRVCPARSGRRVEGLPCPLGSAGRFACADAR